MKDYYDTAESYAFTEHARKFGCPIKLNWVRNGRLQSDMIEKSYSFESIDGKVTFYEILPASDEGLRQSLDYQLRLSDPAKILWLLDKVTEHEHEIDRLKERK